MTNPFEQFKFETQFSKADLDAGKYDRYMQGLRDQQNLVAALLGGVATSAVGAALWAVITYLSGYKFGIMAIVLGFLVGKVVLKVGRGIDIQFRIIGAVLALISCLAGDGLAYCISLAKYQGVSIMSVFSQVQSAGLIWFFKTIIDGGDLIFYAIAVYEGFRFSAKKLTPAEYTKILQLP
jgi:hypothetical protein